MNDVQHPRTCSEPALHSSSKIQVSYWRAREEASSADGRAVAPAEPERTLTPPLAKRDDERLNDAACGHRDEVRGCVPDVEQPAATEVREAAAGQQGTTTAQQGPHSSERTLRWTSFVRRAASMLQAVLCVGV
jgi:hypothetical protein